MGTKRGCITFYSYTGQCRKYRAKFFCNRITRDNKMIFFLVISSLFFIYLILSSIIQFVKAIKILFYKEESFVGGVGVLFFCYKLFWGKQSEKYIVRYRQYANNTMKLYAVLTLVFTPIVLFRVIVLLFVFFIQPLLTTL